MRHWQILEGGSVQVKDPARWCDTDGNPIPHGPLTVVRKQERRGYTEPFIVLEGERFFKACDLQPVKA